MPKQSRNNLYPVFLKPENLQFLIVGGGEVGLEKLTFLLKSSPHAKLRLVAKTIHPEIHELAKGKHIELIERAFFETDLFGMNIAILATENNDTNLAIRKLAKQKNILTNIADTPKYCDFYMGSIVTKGDLKIGISTNGKSPTFAKRFRQFLEEALPDSTPELLDKLKGIRDSLKGDFAHKVEELNKVTENLLKKK
jgi:siroheme synthase-like protein